MPAMNGSVTPPLFALAADVGGTFTDIVTVGSDGSVHRLKTPSTPPNFSEAVVNGLQEVCADSPVSPESLSEVIHGTTAATNAVLELQGARTALVTTKGFRDVLELGRLRRPSLFDTRWEKPEPLVPRRLRFEVNERVTAQGDIERPLDASEVRHLAKRLREQNVESVAICLLNSFANSQHERDVLRVLQQECPEMHFSSSYDILPEIKEYERTSTAVVNAYIHPIVDSYIGQLQGELEATRVDTQIQIMQSNGGLMAGKQARSKPVYMLESGPAAGVTAAVFLARQLSRTNIISFDMGGTTAKVTLIEGGGALETTDYEVGGGMNANRMLRGGGYSVQVPSIDITEVGAGGGSVFWIDEGGAPRVGPRSAGAVPGPACYDMGGKLATVTDANLVLGYLSPTGIAGGARALYKERAVKAVEEQIAQRLGSSLQQAAYGVHALAISNMSKALRAVSMERGRDPRDFALMAFGGAGPMHAVGLAQAFGMSTVIVPNSPGLFSAVGLLAADVRHDYVTSYTRGADVDIDAVSSIYREMEQQAIDEMRAGGHDPSAMTTQRLLDLRYEGQSFELRIPLDAGRISPSSIQEARLRFDAEHEKTYGHQVPDQNVEIVSLRLRATYPNPGRLDAIASALRRPASDARTLRDPTAGDRKAYFGPEWGLVETPVLDRWDLPDEPTYGPFLVEEMDATTVIPPGVRAHVEESGSIVIDLS